MEEETRPSSATPAEGDVLNPQAHEENAGAEQQSSDNSEKAENALVESDVQFEKSSDDSAQRHGQTEQPDKKDNYTEHIHYEDNVAIYTDPSTSYQYVWNNEKNEWVSRVSDSSRENSEPPQGEYGFEGDQHTYTDADGVVYIWDAEKSAWFPKVDDDFMARYQLSYGVTQPGSEGEQDGKDQNKSGKEIAAKNLKEETAGNPSQSKKRPAAQEPAWFDMPKEQNTKVYVTGLPEDITEEEFVEVMSKCGLVERDSKTQKMKVKIYMDANGYPKGDALCTYIRVESVELALNLLDGSEIRGRRIGVQRAKFEMKGDYNPALKPKKVRKKDKEKQKKMKEKLFDWRPEKMRGERSKHERIVVLRNLFEPKLFDEHVELILEFQEDLREECSKLGEVRRVVLYDRHPEGVAQITMAEPEQADAVVALMHDRWFNKRQLKAEIWDGKTKFKIGETDSEISKRLEGWDKFLEEDPNVNDK